MRISELHNATISAFHKTASLPFGRDIARYHELIAFLTLVSLVLWACVLVTTMLRLAAQLYWIRRGVYGIQDDASASDKEGGQ
jgi:hypothetical protein